jgi:hypothetical protein
MERQTKRDEAWLVQVCLKMVKPHHNVSTKLTTTTSANLKTHHRLFMYHLLSLKITPNKPKPKLITETKLNPMLPNHHQNFPVTLS